MNGVQPPSPPPPDSSDTPPPRPTLRTRLIDAAEAEIAEKGLAGLKARALSARAGCALGAIYTHFDDLDALVLQVNSRTLGRLAVALAPAARSDLPPETVTLALADAYAGFALANRRLWSALFERAPDRTALPDWHRQEHVALMTAIAAPLMALRPDLPPEAVAIRSRTLFGAVHGVVQLSLQDRLLGLPEPLLRAELAALVAALVAGARQVSEQMVGGEGLEPPTSSV
ncbi:hypothetical protein MASR1M32_26870 [Rhodobacter sp.]